MIVLVEIFDLGIKPIVGTLSFSTLLDDTLGYVDYFVGLVKPTNYTSSTGSEGTCVIPNFTNILRNIEIDEKLNFLYIIYSKM